MKLKTIYLAGAIRGDPSYSSYYNKIIEFTGNYAFTRTEKSEDLLTLQDFDEKTKSQYKKHVYERDIKWLNESDAVIAECSGASTGVGYEIAYAAHVLELPILCLLSNKSYPSLMIEQNIDEYIIPLKYSNEKDIEFYILVFIKLLEKYNNNSMFKKIYKSILNDLKEMNNIINNIDLDEYIEKKLIIEQKRFIDIEQVSFIDFTNSKDLYDFLFKSIILQYRWSKLKSQRIGKFFVSGRKENIIAILYNVKIGNIFDIYESLDKKKLNYNQYAFKKNLRAYRSIGLLISPVKLKFGGTKLKNNLIVYQTLDNKISINSIVKKHNIMSDDFEVTKYLAYLNMFKIKFTLENLNQFLTKAIQQKWFKQMKEIKIYNIDEIDINNIEGKEIIKEINIFLMEECKNFNEKNFSSYYRKMED
jgi:nucleoside 2-deoxyribosyltransferase